MTQATDSIKSQLSYDFDQALEFVESLQKGQQYSIQALAPEGHPLFDQYEGKTFFFGNIQKHWDELCELNSAGLDVYVVVNTGKPAKGSKTLKAEDISKVNALFVDWDKPDESEPKYQTRPSLIVDTSEGKHHAYWVVDSKTVQVSEFKFGQKNLIAQYGTDVSVCNVNRLMRVPGFYNWKPYYKEGKEPYKVSIRSNSRTVYEGREFDLTPNNNKGKLADVDVAANDLEVYVQKIARCEDGTINHTVFSVAYELGLQNYSYDAFDRVIRQGLQLRGRAGDAHHLGSAERGFNNGKEAYLKAKKSPIRSFHWEAIERAVQGRLKRDEYGQEIFFDGSVATIDFLYIQLSAETGLQLPKDYTTDKLMCLAETPEYQSNQLRDQFLEWAKQYDDESVINEASEHLGLEKDIEKTFLRKFFLRLGARTLYPGCKADEVLVLKGDQGLQKTDFLTTFLGDRRYYAELTGGDNAKDEMQLLNKIAIADMNELEGIFSKRELNSLKGFISKRDDTYRLPYGKRTLTFPRHCVITATANSNDLLRDATGNRRYQIIEVKHVNLPWFQQNAPKIMGWVVNELKRKIEDAGHDPQNTPKNLYLWWVTPEEAAMKLEHDAAYTKEDDLTYEVLEAANYITGEFFTMKQLCARLKDQGIEIKLTSRIEIGRLKRILTEKGFSVDVDRKVNGNRQKVVVKPERAPNEAEQNTVQDAEKMVSVTLSSVDEIKEGMTVKRTSEKKDDILYNVHEVIEIEGEKYLECWSGELCTRIKANEIDLNKVTSPVSLIVF